MEISVDQLAQLSPSMARELIPQWLGTFVEVQPSRETKMVSEVNAFLQQTSDEALMGALTHLVNIGSDYALYRAHPIARDMTRIYMSALMYESTIDGIPHLRDAMAKGPCMLVSNHLAYCDTQVKDLLLARNGADDIAQSIVAVAGPKVYGTVFRRMASAGLSTMKTAQSADVSHNEAALSPREVGRIAIETVQRAGRLMSSGSLVLIYAEGSRSRDGRLQPFLRAVRKYAAVPGLQLVPMAISGTNHMMPLHQVRMFGCPVEVHCGPAVTVDPTDRTGAIAEAWGRIADMLPEENKPEAGTIAVA